MKKLSFNHTIAASYCGNITQAAVNNFMPLLFIILRDELGIPLENMTVLITVNFLIQLIIDLLSAKFINKIGYRAAIVAAHIFAAVGLAGISLFPMILPDKFAGLVVAVCCYAVGGGLTEVLISPIVEACPTENKVGAMSLLHSFYCWGSLGVVLISTIVIAVFGKDARFALSFFWATFALANAFYFSVVPINTLESGNEKMPLRKLFSIKTIWFFMLLMLTAGASELAMSQWASSFAESALGISKMIGDIAGPCLFALFMGLSRVLVAKKGNNDNLLVIMAGSCLLCVLSYVIAAFSPLPVISLVCCGICGFSVGALWPGVYSIAAHDLAKGGTAMFAILALAGDFGCSTGPTVVGTVMGAAGGNMKIGLFSAAVFPAVMFISLIIYIRKKAK